MDYSFSQLPRNLETLKGGSVGQSHIAIGIYFLFPKVHVFSESKRHHLRSMILPIQRRWTNRSPSLQIPFFEIV